MTRSGFARLSVAILSATVLLGSAAPNADARGRRCHTRHRARCCCVQTVTPCVSGAPTAPVATRVLARGTFKSPKTGRIYAFVETNEPGSEVELERELALERARPRALAERRAEAESDDDFVGTDRKDAKTSIGTGEVEELGTLDAVLDSLVSDTKMRHLTPRITRAEHSERVHEEQRNVHVRAYLYATKREADNDFHMILGSESSVASSRWMTAEISGLPDGGDRSALMAPRQAFETQFSNSPIGSRYKKFPEPIPVDITGTLFFDVDHRPPAVGPDGMKPQTAWEIHPVTKIVFEPDGDQ
jgi:hypothetical protein